MLKNLSIKVKYLEIYDNENWKKKRVDVWKGTNLNLMRRTVLKRKSLEQYSRSWIAFSEWAA